MKLSFLKPSATKLATYPQLLQQVDQLRAHYQTGSVTEDELKTLGLTLWHILDKEVTVNEATALVIDSDDPLIQSLPWECLYHPTQGFLGKHPAYTLSRRLSPHNVRITRPFVDFSAHSSCKILLYTAQTQQSPLAVEAEQTYLRTALRPWLTEGSVYLLAPDDGRFATFATLIKQQSWQLVILSGHCLLNQQGQMTFVFEDDTFQDEAVTGETLAQVFSHSEVQCVVLAACQSGKMTATNPSLAWQLRQAGIPHVVGIWETLLDRAGSIFIRAFSVAIAQGMPVDVAMQQGRQAMTQLLTPHEIWCDCHSPPLADPSIGQWCLPMLLSSHFTPLNTTIQLRNFSHFYESETPYFIGRRKELRELGEKLCTGDIRHLLIYGVGGVGKSALAGRLATTLAEQGYQVLTHLSEQLVTLSPGQYLLWLDNVELTPTVYYQLEELQQIHYLRILVTCRHLPKFAHFFQNYSLSPLKYPDFLRYIQHLGMPHQAAQIRLMYQTLAGNFKGVQLLQSLPVRTDMKAFIEQLYGVRRYLQAYWREGFFR